MNTVYEINKTSLLNSYPDLNWLFQKSIDLLPLIPTKNNEMTVIIDNKWIASRYAPANEAQKFVSLQHIQPGDLVVLYGFGLGYHLSNLLNKIGPHGFLYCIETHKSLFKTALTIQDFSHLFQDPRFKLMLSKDKEELAQKLDHYILWNLNSISKERIKVIIHEPSFQIIPREFDWVKNSLEIIKFERVGDSPFINEMKENLKENLPLILECPGINALKKIFKDYPVLLAGAGPSLDKAVNFIKTLQANVFIVCVDSALIPLRTYGIKPDMVVSVDPQDKTMESFISYENEDTPVIIFPTSNKGITKKLKGSKIIAVQKESWVSCFMEHKLDFFGLTLGGSAVSVVGADIVLASTEGPVIFCGMDFAFPYFQSYANFSPEINKWNAKTGPYYTLEMASVEHIYSRKIVYVENETGEMIPTFQSMYSYLRALETILEHYKRNNVYQLFSLGAKINGVNTLYFEEELGNIVPNPIEKNINFPNIIPDPELVQFCNRKMNEI